MYDEIYELLDKEDVALLFEYINADSNQRQKMAERMEITSFYQKIFINEDIADFNGDGYVDANDASMVLTKYAESSTT